MADSGETLSYLELERQSNQIAHLYRQHGLRPGDHVAVLVENCLDYFPIVWAAQRAGLFYTPVNWHLGDDDAAYIVDNANAQMLLHSAALNGAAIADSVAGVTNRYIVGDITGTGERLADALRDLPSTPIDDETEDYYMFYSSGTTGRPKGILPTSDRQALGTGLPIDYRMHAHSDLVLRQCFSAPDRVQRHFATFPGRSAPVVGGRLPTGDDRPLRGLDEVAALDAAA